MVNPKGSRDHFAKPVGEVEVAMDFAVDRETVSRTGKRASTERALQEGDG